MRVRFSPDIFRVERFGGVARYVVELHAGLLERGVDSRILAYLHRNGHLAGVPAVTGLDVHRLGPRILRQGLSKVVDSRLISRAGRELAADDILHMSYFAKDPPRGPRLAVTVYDMIHEICPSTAGPRDSTVDAKRASCRRADLIFAISERTRCDLLERMPELGGRIVVTPLGVRPARPAADAVLPPAPFILYVGERAQPYKNFLGLAEAFARAPSTSDVRLVLFGGGALTPREFDSLERLGILDRIVSRSGHDGVLAALLAGAAGLVCPSLYEGFGLPLLEAMAQGCPVASSNGGALPEVAGDAALLFESGDTDAMAAAIDRLLTDTALVNDLCGRGRKRAALFSWDQTTDRTLAAYRTRLS